ncbi:F-box/kelch-repeat protein SKIP25 [Acetobacter orientalis]|uniref:F-box/kelch-repeat protein SKIP25 n=1 Tax=Acetobacter orientalis TaxID=146474 RepID=A0A2Z5ZHU5_9PROT|nr:F-box/kelch-repeat protein SKIP25 [Acetobacter orientalis]
MTWCSPIESRQISAIQKSAPPYTDTEQAGQMKKREHTTRRLITPLCGTT